uniref:Toll like receptor 5 n=1 Tax=Hucho hucho TaxID=62062 RepID=A0A4W5QSG1_9TELE
MMRNLILLAIFGVYLLVVKYTPRCPLYGSIAACTSQSLHQVPPLPPYITLVYMSGNYISEINETSFSGLEGLKELDLSWQRVNGLIIRTNTFQRLANFPKLGLVGLHPFWESKMAACQMKGIQPALFFVKTTDFQELHVTLNKMKSICENDLLGFQSKHFQLLDLSSIQLNSMTQRGLDWNICRNPLRNMSMEILDLSSNGFNVDKVKLFFNAIRGTKIHHLILEHSTMGKSFCFSNVKDPDRQTVEGFKNSGVKILYLSKCFIFTLQYAVFSPLREVQDITISILTHLKIYSIFYLTTILGYQAFTGLPHLQVLDLTENSIRDLGTNGSPDGIFKGLISLVEMDLHFNFLTYLQPDIFPETLKTLDLLQFLASPDPAAFHSLSWINLYRNRFHCDCGLEDFLMWLNGTNVTFPDPGMDEFSWDFPSNLHGVSLLNYITVISCELSVFICSALISVGTIVLACLRGFLFKVYKKVIARILEGPRKDPPADGPQYDAYVCFDVYKWVETALLKKLDFQLSERNILRCCFEARDFIPGEDHLSNIRDAIWGSRKTVGIVSKEFLKDGLCLEAFTLAPSKMLEELRDYLIMVIVGKCLRPLRHLGAPCSFTVL